MDIRNWSMDQIMQLPDHCFGRRFSIIFGKDTGGGGEEFFISELALPDRVVLWEVYFHLVTDELAAGFMLGAFSLGLSSVPVTANAAFIPLEKILTGVDNIFSGIHVVNAPFHLTRLRLPVNSQGRRVVLYMDFNSAAHMRFSVGLVFSSIPNDVPDLYAGNITKKLDELIRLISLKV